MKCAGCEKRIWWFRLHATVHQWIVGHMPGDVQHWHLACWRQWTGSGRNP